MDDFLGLSSKFWTYVAITILVPLLAFGFGSFFSSLKVKREILRHYKILENYYNAWIKLIKEQIDKQLASLSQFNDQLSNVDNIPLNFMTYNLHIDKLLIYNSLENYSL